MYICVSKKTNNMKATIINSNLSSLSKGAINEVTLAAWEGRNFDRALENKLHSALFTTNEVGRYVPTATGKKVGAKIIGATGQWSVTSIEATEKFLKSIGVEYVIKEEKYTTY